MVKYVEIKDVPLGRVRSMRHALGACLGRATLQAVHGENVNIDPWQNIDNDVELRFHLSQDDPDAERSAAPLPILSTAAAAAAAAAVSTPMPLVPAHASSSGVLSHGLLIDEDECNECDELLPTMRQQQPQQQQQQQRRRWRRRHPVRLLRTDTPFPSGMPMTLCALVGGSTNRMRMTVRQQMDINSGMQDNIVITVQHKIRMHVVCAELVRIKPTFIFTLSPIPREGASDEEGGCEWALTFGCHVKLYAILPPPLDKVCEGFMVSTCRNEVDLYMAAIRECLGVKGAPT